MNAQKNGFFSDDNSFTYVDIGNETTSDVVLYPHAWLEVTLKNESGAYLISAPGENGDRSKMQPKTKSVLLSKNFHLEPCKGDVTISAEKAER